MSHSYDYDLAIIGGGSAGVAAAKQAAALGVNVILCDYTVPGVHGATWRGLGGTCAHVGCSPKKYMHSGSILREVALKDGPVYGAALEEAKPFCWDTIRQNVSDKIMGSDWNYRVEMRQQKILNKPWLVRFAGPHELIGCAADGTETNFTADKIIVAVGGRPFVPEFEGSELAITSDDIFSLDHAPGKTLCVGGGYIALECAGFLSGFGFETEVMVRSRPLRTFDTDAAERVVGYMQNEGVKFTSGALPVRLEKADGRILVTYESTDGSFEGVKTETYDTVLIATGRRMVTDKLNLEAAGLSALRNGRIAVDENDATEVPHIFALGDIRSPGIELTPVAITNARILINRLYNNGTEVMSFDNVPTTVFTPIEYSSCGLTEDEAKEKYDVEIFLTEYKPFEWVLTDRGTAYGKIIVDKATDRVLGVHYVGPNAGEVMQGFAVAIRMGVTKAQWDATVCIHPTAAERLIGVTVTKSSGADFVAASCCG